jgi:DNA-damage-inducible protein J
VVAKVPEAEKARFLELTAGLGTTPSNAIRMFITAFNQRGAFPFDVSQPRYNPTTEAALREAQDIVDGKVVVPSYESFGDFIADLD